MRGRPIIDLRGRRFGAWTVMHRDPFRVNGYTFWLAVCGCGRKAKVRSGSLLHNGSRSCVRCAVTAHAGRRWRRVTIGTETRTLAGWARKLGITREAVRQRLKRGVPPGIACTVRRTFKGGRRRLAA